jgi:4-hydroxybenzoate polyprenyltransferase
MIEKAIEYAKLITINQWGVASLTAFYGALSTGELDFIKLFLLVIIGIQATIFSSVFNDYCDIEVDSLSKGLKDKPLVKGSIPKKHALYISFIAVLIAYIIIFYSMYLDIFIASVKPIFAVTLALMLGILYDLYGKRILGSDFISASAAASFCLFGVLVVSENVSSLSIIIIALVFLQIFFLNAITGGLKDADHDYLYNIKNLIYHLGVRVVNNEIIITTPFKIITLILRAISSILLLVPILFFKNFPYYIWQPLLMFIMLIVIFYSTIKMLNMKKFNRNKIRKMISTQEFLRYTIVPIMLFGFIGINMGLFLIIFPFLWFVVFNKLIYGSALKPKRM